MHRATNGNDTVSMRCWDGCCCCCCCCCRKLTQSVWINAKCTWRPHVLGVWSY